MQGLVLLTSHLNNLHSSPGKPVASVCDPPMDLCGTCLVRVVYQQQLA